MVIELEPRTHEILIDGTSGTATSPAGVSLDALLRTIVPRGYFVPVTPGRAS